MAVEMIYVGETNERGGNEVFINTDRGRAALDAAAYAVAAVAQGQRVAYVGIEERGEDDWCIATDHYPFDSDVAGVIYLFAGPMAPYACGLIKYMTCDAEHVSPRQYWEGEMVIQQWHDCPLYEVPFEHDNVY